MIDWNVYGLALVPAALALAALSVVIYRARSSSPQNQALAMMLLGYGLVAMGIAIGYLATDTGVSRGGFGVAYAAWFVGTVASVRFSASLGVPWLGFLRRAWADRALVLLYFLGPLVAAALLLPRTFAGMASYAPYVPWRPVFHPGAHETWNAVTVLVNLLAIGAAAHAWQRQPAGSPLRKTMGAYFVAALLAEIIAIAGQVLRADIIESVQQGVSFASWKAPAFLLSIVVQLLAYATIYGYAILKAQVFDVDLKIKWTIRKGTLVGAFVTVFVLVSSIVEQWLQQYGIVMGGLAVGLMLLATRPLDRLATRLSDAAMPHVRDSAEYRTVRKREVYRAAVESALEDGSLSDKDRSVLATLAQQLDIGAKDAHDIERSARQARAGVA